MRMWMVEPSLLCRKHLLGQHVELHMLAGTISAGKSLDGYVTNGLIDTSEIASYHNAIAREMKRRGYNHASPLSFVHENPVGVVDARASAAELARRCEWCASRQAGRIDPRDRVQRDPYRGVTQFDGNMRLRRPSE